MAELELGFLLPLPGWPRAVFEGDYSYDSGRLVFDGAAVLHARSRGELERGVGGLLMPGGASIVMQLVTNDRGAHDVQVHVDGRAAWREDALRARPSRSTWIHAGFALAASGAGFVASYLYVLRAAQQQSDWALKMANHMAGWHLLLTFTLFPASLWGQRKGIRLVQSVCLLFFLIHLGIALTNLATSDDGGHSGAIAVFNALSGAGFLAAAIYGNRAYTDMDPAAALRAGRAR
ncbi:MAG: hypothetical protein HYR72_10820 [Deltaproteobacteria bacterium]|nr:hypothetical protein [Deltaproteobacteria bacterium]MBI3388197.1 hypothetical protein [Deltaproteobacteria bacterium]